MSARRNHTASKTAAKATASTVPRSAAGYWATPQSVYVPTSAQYLDSPFAPRTASAMYPEYSYGAPHTASAYAPYTSSEYAPYTSGEYAPYTSREYVPYTARAYEPRGPYTAHGYDPRSVPRTAEWKKESNGAWTHDGGLRDFIPFGYPCASDGYLSTIGTNTGAAALLAGAGSVAYAVGDRLYRGAPVSFDPQGKAVYPQPST